MEAAIISFQNLGQVIAENCSLLRLVNASKLTWCIKAMAAGGWVECGGGGGGGGSGGGSGALTSADPAATAAAAAAAAAARRRPWWCCWWCWWITGLMRPAGFETALLPPPEGEFASFTVIGSVKPGGTAPFKWRIACSASLRRSKRMKPTPLERPKGAQVIQ